MQFRTTQTARLKCFEESYQERPQQEEQYTEQPCKSASIYFQNRSFLIQLPACYRICTKLLGDSYFNMKKLEFTISVLLSLILITLCCDSRAFALQITK